MIARDFYGIAIIKAEVPSGQEIPILHAPSPIESVSRRCKRIARGSEEAAQRERPGESVAVVDQSDAGERVPVDVVEFKPRAEVLVIRYGAARTDSQMRSNAKFAVIAGNRVGQIDAHPVGVHARIDEQFRAVSLACLLRTLGRLIRLVTRFVAVAHEACKLAEALAEDIATDDELPANGRALPRMRIAQHHLVLVVIGHGRI